MMTNDILRRLRFAVKMSDPAMLEMIGLGGSSASREELGSYFLKEDEAGYAECPKAVLSALLDGMIVKRRGPRADGAPAPAPALPRGMGPGPAASQARRPHSEPVGGT
ncbi:MAG: DUF1456 family protein [Spirochaetes bacterium]|nr:DUF1456 family protein [Spirochaetota bacterium]